MKRGIVVQFAKICVVDDCVDEATILCDGLKLFGYETVAAYSGAEALDRIRQETIHLVLLDVGLPDLDGYDVCRQLKSDPATADIPVIFVTARGSTRDVAHGYDLGAVDYVAKPYNLPIIVIHVDAALRTHQGRHELLSGPYLLADPVYTDQLTGLRNRRFLYERLQEETEKAHRYRYPMSCMMLELEDAMMLSADAGALPLDDLLVEVAMVLRNSSRTFDILARYDDAQFAAVLPHIKLSDALLYANKIKQVVRQSVSNSLALDLGADLSIGIVSCNSGLRAPSADEILGEAMRNLLIAKSGAPNHISARDLNASMA